MDIIKTKEAGTKAAQEITRALQESTGPTLFLLSGGSSLGILKNVDLAGIDSRVTIGMLDERFSIDPKINNFSQLMSLDFYAMAQKKGAKFIDSSFSPEETIESAAQRIENELKKWKKENPEGKVIVTLGVGPDCHTSGIMPYPENKVFFRELFLSDRWVVGYDAVGKNEYSERISVTATFLMHIVDESISCIQGEAKRNALEKITAGRDDIHEAPGRLIHMIKKATVVTDIL